MSRNALALCVFATFTYLVLPGKGFPRRIHEDPLQRWKGPPSPWEVYEVEDGNRFYYHPVTKETSWDPPPPRPLPPTLGDYIGPSGRYMGSLSLLFGLISIDVIVDFDGTTRTLYFQAEYGDKTIKRCGPVAYTLDLDEEKGTAKYSGAFDPSRGPPMNCYFHFMERLDGTFPWNLPFVWEGRYVPDTVTFSSERFNIVGTYLLRLENQPSSAQRQAQQDL